MVVGEFKEQAELVVVGGGPGGYAAAFHAADLGLDVALVEQDRRLGGTCLLRGCIPSKVMISAAERFHAVQHSDFMGISVKDAKLDMKKMGAWRDKIIQDLSGGLDGLAKGRNIRRFTGRGYLKSANELQIASEGSNLSLQFKQAILALGSTPIMPAPFVKGPRVLSSDEAIGLNELPASLLVVGGGYIGIELGSCLAALGSQVTVVEMFDRLLPGIDLDLVRVVQKSLEKRGVKLHLNSKVVDVQESKTNVKVTVEPKSGAKWTGEFDRVLVAIGRKPNTQDMGLEKLGVAMEKGFITINERCQTSVPHLFAIGDCSGQPMLAHRARRMGIVAAGVAAGKSAAFDNRTIPAVVFSEPEIAYCGMSEEEAKQAGHDVKVGRFRFAPNGRAMSLGQTEGMVFVIADAKSETVLGVRMVGPHVSELIGEATLAVEMAATLEDLIATIHVHPTLSETFMEAAEAARGEALHSVRASKGKPAMEAH